MEAVWFIAGWITCVIAVVIIEKLEENGKIPKF